MYNIKPGTILHSGDGKYALVLEVRDDGSFDGLYDPGNNTLRSGSSSIYNTASWWFYNATLEADAR